MKARSEIIIMSRKPRSDRGVERGTRSAATCPVCGHEFDRSGKCSERCLSMTAEQAEVSYQRMFGTETTRKAYAKRAAYLKFRRKA